MSEVRLIADQAERTLAATDLSTTYIVEAAAGTGKTTLLVERILTIIRARQVPLERIVAITFTEKAAGELKIKLRTKLEEHARLESEHRHSYRQALLALDSMPVSTIHAFCRELIQERPVEAGVEPNFSVTSQSEAELLREEVWQEWIAKEFSGNCPAVLPLLERDIAVESARGFTLRALYDLLLNYREDLEHLRVKCLDDVSLLKEILGYRAKLSEDLTILRECKQQDDGLALELLRLLEWLTAAPDDLPGAIEWLEQAPELKKNQRGAQPHWSTKQALDTARLLSKEFPERKDAVYAQAVSRWANEAIAWLKHAVAAYDRAKAERGVLDFHDLLIIARDMLRTNEAARAYFKQRFNYLLVDEFQDTDPLQAEIAFYLAETQKTFAAEWEKVELVPGKLFIVGDPKQSIYRFRRADLDLYGKVRSKIETVGKCLHIRVNFRSRPDILREVNELFETHMTGARGGRYEPEYVALEPFLESAQKIPQVVFLPPPTGWWEAKALAQEQANAEAACIAEYIREQVDEQGLALRDIGILYSATTHLGELENALRTRGIPYQVAGGKKFIERSEVLALRAVIAALDNSFDEMNVVGALRSPFFACSDEELFAQKVNGAGFNYTADEGKLPHVESCFAILRDLHSKKFIRTPAETLTALFERTKGLQIHALKPQGEGRIANLLKVLEYARTLEANVNASFHALAQRLSQLERAGTGEEDSATAEAGDDVVQLLTFHKAKGLEFSLVMLFRLGVGSERKANCIISRNSKALEFSARKGFATAGYAAAWMEENERSDCEEMRKLYVAMTRAKEQLVIPAYWNEASKGFYALLRGRFPADANQVPRCEGSRFVLQDTHHYSLDNAPAEALKLELELPATDARVTASLARKAEWETARKQAIEKLHRDKAFAIPSQLIEFESSGNGGGADALTFGSYVHRLLERVALPDGKNLDLVWRSLSEEFGVQSEQAEHGAGLVRAALSSDLFKRIRASKAVYREVPFTDLHEEVLWEGVIDLVFEEQGELVIVDFKTGDNVAPASYALQLHAYKRALEKITGKPVTETLIYNLSVNRVFAV